MKVPSLCYKTLWQRFKGKKCKRKSNCVTTSQGKGKTVSILHSWEKESLANWALHHAIYFLFFPEGCYKRSSCSPVTHRHTDRWSCSHWQEKCFVSLPRAVKAVQAPGRDRALFASALSSCHLLPYLKHREKNEKLSLDLKSISHLQCNKSGKWSCISLDVFWGFMLAGFCCSFFHCPHEFNGHTAWSRELLEMPLSFSS